MTPRARSELLKYASTHEKRVPWKQLGEITFYFVLFDGVKAHQVTLDIAGAEPPPWTTHLNHAVQPR